MTEKMISIIIPHYQEESEKILPLLYSIHNQVGIDFGAIEVIISSDGPDSAWLEEIELHKFNFQIRHIVSLENGGPGMARQAGLDESTGKYAIFCDADDVLHNVGVLGYYLDEIKGAPFVLLTTNWLEEVRHANGVYRYIPHKHDLTWMHGKLINLDFVRQNNIRHHPELKVHEDSYFLSLIQGFTNNPQEIRHADVTTYMWKYYDDTITRINDGAYTFHSFAVFIRAIGYSLDEIAKLNKPEMMCEKIAQLICYVYFVINSPAWDGHDAEREASLKALRETICNPFKEHFARVNEADFIKIYRGERAKHAGYIERDTFAGWLLRHELPLRLPGK